MDKQGLLLCAKYSIPPNYFGYCGPSKSLNLIDHLKENIADKEVSNILAEFETLYPYLQLIAYKNKIIDVFDKRVVEAYWIGNDFLNKNYNQDYKSFIKEKLLLDKKINKESFNKIAQKLFLQPVLPHHSFHVFNIFKRTGNDQSFHTLSTMDECRIGWGKIIKNEKLKMKNYFVMTKSLIINDNILKLGKSVVKELKINYKGKSFLKNLKIGDWVSFHWGFICDKITEVQVRNIEFYTQKAIDYYNTSII